MILLPPTSTLFPYTTLFRSARGTGHFGFHPARKRQSDSRRTLVCQYRGKRRTLAPAATETRAIVAGTTPYGTGRRLRSEEHTSELQSRRDLVCRLLLEKKKK